MHCCTDSLWERACTRPVSAGERALRFSGPSAFSCRPKRLLHSKRHAPSSHAGTAQSCGGSSAGVTRCVPVQAQHKRLPKPYDGGDSDVVLQHAQGLARSAGQEGKLDKVCCIHPAS